MKVVCIRCRSCVQGWMIIASGVTGERGHSSRFSFWGTFFGFVEDGFEGPEESDWQGNGEEGTQGKWEMGGNLAPQGAGRESLVTEPDVSAGLIPGWLSFTSVLSLRSHASVLVGSIQPKNKNQIKQTTSSERMHAKNALWSIEYQAALTLTELCSSEPPDLFGGCHYDPGL